MKFKNFIKKNSIPLMLFVLLLVIIIAGLLFVGMFVPSNKNGIYGDRLKDIADNPLGEKEKNDAKTEILKDKSITDATITVKGRIVYLHLYMKELDRKDAMKKAETVFAHFTEKQKSYYDFQIAIQNEGKTEEDNYTMFGARNHGSKETLWTNYE